MADSDVHEAIQLDADIDALVSPNVSQLWRAMHGYTAEATGAVAAHRALSGGGGSSPLQVIGPFTKGHAAFGGIGGNFPTKLTDLDSGSLVLASWAVPTSSFDGTAAELVISIAPQADLTNGTTLAIWSGAEDTTDPTFRSSLSAAGTFSAPVAVAGAGAALIAYYSNSGGVSAPTVGSADFYALINVPT